MKKMKLFCGIITVLIIFTACSKNDDSNNNQISIVGTWKPVKDVNVCSTGSEEVDEYSNCLQMSRTTFRSDGTFNSIEYNDETGNCEEFSYSGTWEINDNNLTLIIDGKTNSPSYFELTESILRIGYYNPDIQNYTCGNGTLTNTYAEFIKVE